MKDSESFIGLFLNPILRSPIQSNVILFEYKIFAHWLKIWRKWFSRFFAPIITNFNNKRLQIFINLIVSFFIFFTSCFSLHFPTIPPFRRENLSTLASGLFQTSNFSCAEPNELNFRANVNVLKSLFKFICIWFGAWKVRRLKQASFSCDNSAASLARFLRLSLVSKPLYYEACSSRTIVVCWS